MKNLRFLHCSVTVPASLSCTGETAGKFERLIGISVLSAGQTIPCRDTGCVCFGSARILFAYGQALARAQQPSYISSMKLLLQIPLFYVVLKDLIRHLIQFLRSQLRFSLSVIYLTGSHIVRPPVPAIVAVVQQQRLDIVHRVCKF